MPEWLQYGIGGLLAMVLAGIYALVSKIAVPITQAAIESLRSIPQKLDQAMQIAQREGEETRKILRDLFDDQRAANGAAFDRLEDTTRQGRCRYGLSPSATQRLDAVREPPRPGEYRAVRTKKEER